MAAFLRRLGGPAAAPESTDRELLARFAAHGDQEAFAAVVARHGSLVLNVCRRLLRHEQDAEDAFQATFLVLARRAAQIPWTDSIVSWLHEVAWRTAAETRGRRARQGQREKTMSEPPDVPAPAQTAWDELSALLDQELRRLPDRYRAPLVLCYLEGRSRDEAAELLGLSAGSVKGRLERGRELLRKRLVRRGVSVAGGLGATLPAGLAQAAPGAAMVQRAVEVATATPGKEAPLAWAVAESVLASLTRGKGFFLAAFVVFVLAGVGMAMACWPEDDHPPAPAAAPAPAQAPERPPAADELPPPARLADRFRAPPKLVRFEVVAGPKVAHGGNVEGLAVTSDGRRVLTAAFNDGFTMFDAADGTQVHRWDRRGPHTIVKVGPHDRLVAAGTVSGGIAVFELESRKEKALWQLGRGSLLGLAFSPDDAVLAAAHSDGSVALLSVDTGDLIRDLKSDQGLVRPVVFTPRGDLLLVGGKDGTVRFWDWKAGKEVDRLAAHSKNVISMALGRDGRRLVTGGLDATVRCWDLETKAELFARPAHYPNSVALSADGQFVACGDSKGVVTIWAGDEGLRLTSIEAHRGGVMGLAFAPDGRRLFSCGMDRNLALWDLRPFYATPVPRKSKLPS